MFGSQKTKETMPQPQTEAEARKNAEAAGQQYYQKLLKYWTKKQAKLLNQIKDNQTKF